MKLYNITYNLEDVATTLIPKIPHSAGDGEDKTIPRICLADSLEHCLQAFGSAYRNLTKGTYILIREVEVDKNSEYLKTPLFLKQNKRVPDALENNEYWYLKPITCNVRVAEIIDSCEDFALAWTCIPIKKCREIISKYSNINVENYNKSNELYDAFMDWADRNKKWDEMDAVWDELLEIPWSQKTVIEKLEVKYL